MGLINDKAFVQTVCKIGQGHKCCRYLTMDTQGWDCVKLTPQRIQTLLDVMEGVPATMTARQLLDARVANETMVARGDNCEGR